MTEITCVPLQPIARGSLAKLWLGVIVAILLGVGLAWVAMPKGVTVDVVREGSGPNPAADDVIFVNYIGRLTDGTEFDRSRDIPIPVEGLFPKGSPLPLGRMIPGFAEGAVQMQKGGKYRLFIPADKGYGKEGQKDQAGKDVIPPDSDLVFEVELIDFMPETDFQRRFQLLQQAMQAGQGAAGAPPQGAPGQ